MQRTTWRRWALGLSAMLAGALLVGACGSNYGQSVWRAS
jgi:hypothetical protein